LLYSWIGRSFLCPIEPGPDGKDKIADLFSTYSQTLSGNVAKPACRVVNWCPWWATV
jgi:hypothetical protein